MRYFIEHWIETLAHNAVWADEKSTCRFSRDEIDFSHFDFNKHDGWKEDAWIASGYIEATDYIQAINDFRAKLHKIIPKISLVSQSYIDFISQSFLITRKDYDVGFLRYTHQVPPSPLMFMENELEALDKLSTTEDIPEEFYFYWNDVINSFGHTSKLLSVVAAIECISKKPNGDADWDKRKLILGEELVSYLWGKSKGNHEGLRHRLSHGDYYIIEDGRKNYLELIHKKVMKYFNKYIFKKDLLNLDVVNPQRHFFGNREEGRWFIKPKPGNALNIKDVLSDFNKNDIHNTENYEYEWEYDIDGKKRR
jgi:hypothetical protein